MSKNVLLYGATGFSGGLIAAEGKARGMSNAQAGGPYRMILAAREGPELCKVADKNCMGFRVFGLDDRAEVRKGLDSIDVVINAAGPFAFTAEPLTKIALEMGCHCVDINGEADVYMKLDDLGLKATQRGAAIVSAAGNTAAASDVLLEAALQQLYPDKGVTAGNELGTIRIAVSQLMDFSRGSAETVARSLREQVIVVRRGQIPGSPEERLVIWHEPVGKLERTFDFGPLADDRDDREDGVPRIASAANLIDTLTARLAVERQSDRLMASRKMKLSVHAIESYVQTGTLGKFANLAGGMLAPFTAFPLVRTLIHAPLSLLPDGPTQQELNQERHVVVLDIEDASRTRVIDWRWETPNVYQFTAQLAVAVASAIVKSNKSGWVTPADALGLSLPDLENPSAAGPLRGCVLQRRTG